MNNFNLGDTFAAKDEWLTPPHIIKALGEFDLDPCAPERRPWDTAKRHLDIHDDGLSAEWSGRVWCNPPYGKETFTWRKKLSDHGDGVALIFARTETKGFHEQVWNRASALFFFRGRLAFYNSDGTLPKNNGNAPSVLVAYGDRNADALKRSGLDGKFIFLRSDMDRIMGV